MKRGARTPIGEANGSPEVHRPAVTAEDLETALRARGLKRTAERTAVLEAFAAAGEHVSAEELTALVRHRLPGVSPSTVYRTLNVLVSAGLASERTFGDGHTRFEPERPEHHDHLICTSCGRIVEFRDDEIERLQTAVAQFFGFEIATHKYELYGTCPGCLTARNAGKAT
jgi:Fur family transcriptional regulator, ferric uptake regulator